MLKPGLVARIGPICGATARSEYDELQAVIYDFAESRSGQHARDFLGAWRGKLVCDDYSGYKALFERGVIEIGCTAHARRKFHDLYVNHRSDIAEEALRLLHRACTMSSAKRESGIWMPTAADNCVSSVRSRSPKRSDSGSPASEVWCPMVRHREGHQLQSGTLGSADTLSRRWRSAHRQQSYRKSDPASGPRKRQLALLRVAAGRQARRGDHEL